MEMWGYILYLDLGKIRIRSELMIPNLINGHFEQIFIMDK